MRILPLTSAALACVSLASRAQAQCTTLANTDYDQGSGGPSPAAANASACCDLCASAGAASCWAAVFDPQTGCWFKTQAQTTKGVYNEIVTACWPSGRVPPPPPSPPPPPKYTASIVTMPDAPVISFLAGQTDWPQSFNPAYVQPSVGTGHKQGLLVRSQNCTGWTPGQCIGCNVDGGHPIAPWFPGSVVTFAQLMPDGTFAKPYLVFAPDASQPEDYGTEDPRLTFDPSTQLYHLFYTCYSSKIGPRLCHATTTDPTAPIAEANWTRYGQVFPDDGPGTKSGALLIRDAPPHYLIWGAGVIHLATSSDLYSWTTINSTYILPRGGGFDDSLVEAGPSPMRLADGNYVFFHNSDNSTHACYNAEWSIISYADPRVVLQRAPVPLISPTRDWELGEAPAECNVGCVVFLEAATPVLGQPNTFDVYFGGSDAVIGTARVKINIGA